ncbi:MAG: argininosuccinate synthase [Atopobiaceae bacterium]|jgi:argininosuccinate synthase|nr:argininosuccinate synthase [Atopobiaceae bacterium]MCI2173502.1 argininosuccinate synthase [Atopobiaceae bacterium]MCI2207497.1 argininosuccinate synthase [Atopobiaceae bacterium]
MNATNTATTSTAPKGKVVLAYSGGLDTSALIPYLENQGYEVVTAIASLGQPGSSDIDAIAEKATSLGATASYAIDMREEFCDVACVDAIAANGMYENKYPLLSALSRPIICKHLVEVAHKEGAVAIAHGCTGKGNDQVRFELECKALDPELDILGPVRTWELTTRNSEIEYCAAHGIEIEVTKKSPYSIDENVWGRAIECGILENPWNEPPADAWVMTVDATEAPDEPTDVVISFEAGKPVAVDGTKMSMLALITKLNKLAGGNGYGRIDMIEDRLVGLKSRECYEQPAALTLIKAHKALESLCLPGDVLASKLKLEHDWAKQVYSGLWYSPLKDACDAFFASTQATVTGDVRIRLYKGSATVTGIKSEHSMYDFGLATYDEGDTFDRSAAKGFMDLFGLPNKVWAQRKIEAAADMPAAPEDKPEVVYATEETAVEQDVLV